MSTTWQIINIVLCWVFFGFLSSYIATRKGREPRLWFLLGLVLGLLGVILVYFLPSPKAKKNFKSPPSPERSEVWMKMWYYLDPQTREQKGPMEFPEFANTWKAKTLNDTSLVWGEGMKEWKPLSQLPEVVKEIESSQSR